MTTDNINYEHILTFGNVKLRVMQGTHSEIEEFLSKHWGHNSVPTNIDNVPFDLERARAGDAIEVKISLVFNPTWVEYKFLAENPYDGFIVCANEEGIISTPAMYVRMKRKTVTKYLNVWLSEEDITGVEAFLYDYKDVAEKISDPDSRPLILKCHPIEVPID